MYVMGLRQKQFINMLFQKSSVTPSSTWIYVMTNRLYNLMKHTLNNIHALEWNHCQSLTFMSKMQPLVKLYVELTNHMLHVTCVAKCCHNLHDVTSLHRGIKDSIGKWYHVTKNNVIKQGQTRVMLHDISGFAEPLLTGVGCVTARQEALTDREWPPQS